MSCVCPCDVLGLCLLFLTLVWAIRVCINNSHGSVIYLLSELSVYYGAGITFPIKSHICAGFSRPSARAVPVDIDRQSHSDRWCSIFSWPLVYSVELNNIKIIVYVFHHRSCVSMFSNKISRKVRICPIYKTRPGFHTQQVNTNWVPKTTVFFAMPLAYVLATLFWYQRIHLECHSYILHKIIHPRDNLEKIVNFTHKKIHSISAYMNEK